MTDNGIDTLFGYNPIGFNGGTGMWRRGGGVSLPARRRGVEMYASRGAPPMYDVGFGAPIGGGAARWLLREQLRRIVWGRIDYKFGGMVSTGTRRGQAPARELEETSFNFGVFGYWGNGTGIDFPVDDADRQCVQPARQATISARRLRQSLLWGT